MNALKICNVFMQKLLKRIVPLAIISMLSGCALVPGMKIDNNTTQENVQTTLTDVNPTIIPINDQLIAEVAKGLNPYVYHVGPGDQLNVMVWGHPEFSSPAGQAVSTQASSVSAGQGSVTGLSALSSSTQNISGYLVDGKGQIFIPLLGNITVAGLSEPQIAALLTKKLAAYVKNPQVVVQVTNFGSQKVYVLGELNQNTQGGASALLPITETPMTLAYALSAIGGINQSTADTREIYVIRGSLQRPTVYWLDAESPVALLYADNFPLQNHDVVFVSTAPIVRFNRALNQILVPVQTLWYTNSLINNFGNN